jgi:hypothetical protein
MPKNPQRLSMDRISGLILTSRTALPNRVEGGIQAGSTAHIIYSADLYYTGKSKIPFIICLNIPTREKYYNSNTKIISIVLFN